MICIGCIELYSYEFDSLPTFNQIRIYKWVALPKMKIWSLHGCRILSQCSTSVLCRSSFSGNIPDLSIQVRSHEFVRELSLSAVDRIFMPGWGEFGTAVTASWWVREYLCVGILTRHCLVPRAKGLELFEAYLLWPGDAIMHQGAVEFSMFIMISGRSCLAVAELSPIDIA